MLEATLAGLYVLRLRKLGEPHARRAGAIVGLLGTLVLLWAGTLEIDRAFAVMGVSGGGLFSDPRLAEQVVLSIFWSAFAVGAVGVGFRLRATPLRYFGLALLALTLLKVMAIDLSQVSRGYRILSFVGLGMLMLGTSVLYGKLSPKLLGAESTKT